MWWAFCIPLHDLNVKIIMPKKYLTVGFIGTIIVSPLVAYAQTKTLATLISTIVGYFNIILDLIMGMAVVMFVWYVIQYFIQPNDKRAEGAQYVMWAVVGFFVILSMWGLVNILTNTFNLGNNNPSSWSSISNLFPSDGGSSGSNSSGSNIFNQGGTPSYNSSPSSNYSSGFTSGSQSNYGTSGGTQGGSSNSISPFGSSGNTGATNYSSGRTGTGNSGSSGNTYGTNSGVNGGVGNSNTGANATTAINNPSNNLNAGGTVSSQSNGVIYYANGQYYDTKTGINYNSNGQQISSPNYNASTGQYINNSATGSTGNTASGQTTNPPDVSGRIQQMQVSNGCLDTSGNAGPNAGNSTCQNLQDSLQNNNNIQSCIGAGVSAADCTSEYGAGGNSATGSTNPNNSSPDDENSSTYTPGTGGNPGTIYLPSWEYNDMQNGQGSTNVDNSSSGSTDSSSGGSSCTSYDDFGDCIQ
jgi:hypothetical protein